MKVSAGEVLSLIHIFCIKGGVSSSSTSGSQAKIVPVGKRTAPMSSTSTPIFLSLIHI